MFEQNLNSSLFAQQNEKTYVDKLLAKDDIKSIREIIKKPELGREDMLELLDYLSSSEAKLLNLDEWGRYIMNKFFVWIRDFCRMYELMYDYEQQLKDEGINLDNTTKKLFANNKLMLSHDVKFLADLYLNIGRTTLSLGGSALLEFARNKFEFSYPGAGVATPQQNTNPQLMGMQQQKRGLFK
jgi:hypothetical protein